MDRQMKTTRPVIKVRTIDDIKAIENQPYDTLVTARNLYDLFLATALHVGDSQALTVLRSPDPQDVGVSYTHSELLSEITRAANMFRALGLGPGQGVAAFLAPTLPELPALLMGAQIAGIASTLNYLLSHDALVDLLNAQAATILVIPSRALDEMCWTKAQGVLDRVPTLRHVIVIGDDTAGYSGFVGLDDALKGIDSAALDFQPTTDRDTVCALFHTGGTTGQPKLVQLTHGNQIHAAFGFGQVFGYDENDTVMNGFPFFHVGGTMTVGLSVIAAGGHVIVPSPYGLRPPAAIAAYWDLVKHFGVTVVGGVPTSIASLTQSWDGDDVTSVRMAATGGAVLPNSVGTRFEEVTGIRLYETYGMTETAAAIAFNPGRGAPIAGSVGLRAPFSDIRIVSIDAADLTLCPRNQVGLVQVRGPQVFPGYLDKAHNEGVLSDGWLTTGDVGYLRDDDRLVLTGREKDLIVRSGHNIDPAAIEDVANQFKNVAITAAVGMPDQYAGEVPALFVVSEPGTKVDLVALKDYIYTHISEAPARPKSVMAIDALPVTAVGKIFKPTLRDLAIREKIRLEISAVCGAEASAEIDIKLDQHRNTVVDVLIQGSNPEVIARLEQVLKPLQQTYLIRSSK
jgi:fatty-acyl-CoA synthase